MKDHLDFFLIESANLQYATVQKILDAFKVDENEIWGVPPSVVHDMYEAKEGFHKLFTKQEIKKEVTLVPIDAYMMVEYVDLAASAGALGLTNIEMLPETKLRLVLKEFDRGNYLVVRVDGDSMVYGTDISIPDGTEILVKEYTLEPGEKLPIRGNLFVICSSEGNVFKQITEHNTLEGYIKCHSYNPKYNDYIISLNEVHQIFVYRKIVSYRPSIPEIKN